MRDFTRKNTVSGFFWRFFEACGAQGVTFIVSLVLARLLDPADYGTIALVSVFIIILNIFIDSGMATALIQKKEADDLDFSTLFWFNLVMCFFLYFLLFVSAPLISDFYNRPELVPLIRVLGLKLIISGVKSIQQSYVSRNILFKKYFFATLGGTIGAAFIGIWMAVNGFGVWALVTQSLFNNTVDTIILWFTVRWRPKFIFSIDRLKTLFSYGWKLLAAKLLDTIYNKIRQLIIGKMYTSEDLAFYNKGDAFPQMLVNNINSSIDSVLFPAMSAAQDSAERVKEITRRAISLSTYILMPMMMGLAVCAEPFVRLILTEKWLPTVPYLRIFCFVYAFYPIHTSNLNAIKALGRSDLFLKLEIIKKAMGLVVLTCTMWWGSMIMAYSLLFTSIASQVVNSWPNKKLMDYAYLEQVKDMLPQIGLSCLMGAIVYCVNFLGLSDFVALLIQIPLGVVIYIIGSKVLHIDSFDYILETAKQFLPRKNNQTEKNLVE